MHNPIHLAILVPVAWALADFLSKILIGCCGSKRAVLFSQISASLWTILLLFVLRPPFAGVSLVFALSLGSSAILSALAWIFFFKGLQGRLSITEPIAYTWPLITIVLSISFYGERLSGLDLLGIALALVGLLILSFPEQGRIHGDVKYGLLAMLCWGVGTFLLKPAILYGGPYYTVLGSRFIQLGLIAPFVLFTGREPLLRSLDRRTLLLAILVGAGNGLPFVLFNWLIVKLGAALPAAISSVSPALVVVLSALFLKEKMTHKQILGAAGAVAGLVLLSI